MIVNVVVGAALLVTTAALVAWSIPKDGQPSPIPSKWGLPWLVPTGIVCFAIGGLVFLARALI
jgi:hypothetical protein